MRGNSIKGKANNRRQLAIQDAGKLFNKEHESMKKSINKTKSVKRRRDFYKRKYYEDVMNGEMD